MSLADIKNLVKESKIRGVSHLNKKELIAKLDEKGIAIPEKKPRQKKELVTEVKVVDPKFDRLKTIRTNPRKVSIRNIENDETVEYKSMYSAARFLNKSSKVITDNNGKTYKGKYEIKIL